MKKYFKKIVHKLIVRYLINCGGAFHCFPYGEKGRYVRLFTDEEYDFHQKMFIWLQEYILEDLKNAYNIDMNKKQSEANICEKYLKHFECVVPNYNQIVKGMQENVY